LAIVNPVIDQKLGLFLVLAAVAYLDQQ
jgi:hypothetical protein